MDKIYGYKEKDIIGLAQFLKQNDTQSLSAIFEKYAVINGKAKGTVRNLYYALAKKSNSDKQFCDKYLNGKPLIVSKIVEFNQLEERELIKKVLLEKQKGRSVRATIMEIANGDGKIALRYQNKYRNAIKSKPKMIAEIIEEIKSEGYFVQTSEEKTEIKNIISQAQYNRLKAEIDNLAQKISLKLRKENEYLKERINLLESENLKLITLLYDNGKNNGAKKYFKEKKIKQFIN